jgi:hypothetical protein
MRPTAILVSDNAAASGAGVGSKDNSIFKGDRADRGSRLGHLETIQD